MLLLWIISLCFLTIYFLRIGTCLAGWYRHRFTSDENHSAKPDKKVAFDLPAVSVVIPARNEGSNIAGILSDMVRQDYPTELLEVIVVNDHSSDNTAEAIKSFSDNQDWIHYLKMDPAETGKKAALRKGVNRARNRIILNTDADCRAPATWVSEVAACFNDRAIRMIPGSVVFEPDRGFFSGMQSLEFFSLTAIAAGSAGLGRPILCNAANLAYYREDYLKFVKEEKPVTESGDDIFLMLWLKRQYPASIGFLSVPGSVITTRPAPTIASFIRQRMRWSSKSRFYRDVQLIATSVVVYGFNVLLFAILIAILAELVLHGTLERGLPLLFLILFSGKIIADLLILWPVTKHFGKTRLLKYFIPLEIIYFVYASLIGLAGQILSFTWKGRRIRH